MTTLILANSTQAKASETTVTIISLPQVKTDLGLQLAYAAPMTEVMLLGVLAVNHGGRIEWDSKNMKITNRPELNAYLTEPVRKGWEYGQDLWT